MFITTKQRLCQLSPIKVIWMANSERYPDFSGERRCWRNIDTLNVHCFISLLVLTPSAYLLCISVPRAARHSSFASSGHVCGAALVIVLVLVFSSGNAIKTCTKNATWFEKMTNNASLPWTDYTPCVDKTVSPGSNSMFGVACDQYLLSILCSVFRFLAIYLIYFHFIEVQLLIFVVVCLYICLFGRLFFSLLRLFSSSLSSSIVRTECRIRAAHGSRGQSGIFFVIWTFFRVIKRRSLHKSEFKKSPMQRFNIGMYETSFYALFGYDKLLFKQYFKITYSTCKCH